MAVLADCLRLLEQTDCAGGCAPADLIYSQDIADKVPAWWDEIDATFYEYEEELGEAPRFDGSLTITKMVWFAVEWRAVQMASALRAFIEDNA